MENAEAKPFNEKAQAIRKAQRQRVAPAVEALVKEYASEFVDVSLGQVAPAKASGGIGTNPRTVWVEVSGDRALAETIANLLASSSLGAVAKK